jgi:hypothetical protein
VHWNDAVVFSCSWEYLGLVALSLGATTISLGAPGSADHKHESTLNTLEQSGKSILFGNAPDVPGNHRYYILLNDF